MPRGELKAVCAHELSHAWVFENVPAARKRTLGGDAHEGFCELVAYLLMVSQEDQDEIDLILKNRYTRGQIDCFIEAEQRFGFNEIIDWMKYGQDAALHKEDLNRIRNLQLPARTPAGPSAFPAYTTQTPSAPSGFILKGVSWTRERPLAVINNRTFELKEQGQVKIGGTNVLIRCLVIRQDGARIRILSSGEERELALEER